MSILVLDRDDVYINKGEAKEDEDKAQSPLSCERISALLAQEFQGSWKYHEGTKRTKNLINHSE